MEPNKANFQNHVLSVDDLKSVILEVRKYITWFNQTEIKMKVTKNNSYELPAISATATEIINEWLAGNAPAQKNLDELMAALEDFEASAPRVTITLAAPPPNSLKKSLADWFRQNVSPNMLVNFKFNGTILGGMVVSYKSHIYDWSFRRQVLSSREKFPEVLRRV
jgi:hypothetical protein